MKSVPAKLLEENMIWRDHVFNYSPWIVYIQSMTLFLTIFQGSLMAKCHWPKSMTHGHKPDVHNQTVIDQSMTLCKGAGCPMVSAQTVIDWSMTLFEDLLENCHWPVNDTFHRDIAVRCTFRNCHWPVNDSFQWPTPCGRKEGAYIEVSLTG